MCVSLVFEVKNRFTAKIQKTPLLGGVFVILGTRSQDQLNQPID